MTDQKSKFLNKVSPLIEGQVPDFVQADHPVFVDFVKDYFSFLEAGRLTVSQTINYITLETNTSAYIIDEEDEERIVTEKGEGTQSKFINGETITGATSSATGVPSSSSSTVDSAVFSSGYSNPEMEPDSGDIIYIENRRPISRASDQTEDIKIIVEF